MAAAPSKQEVVAEVTTLLDEPIPFVRRVLRQATWSTQEAILDSVRRFPLTAIKGCHASSKTFAAAALVLWWLARYAPRPGCPAGDGVVITTGPTARQIRLGIWAEIHAALANSWLDYGTTPNQMEMKLGPKSYAIGMATGQRSRGVMFQGLRAANTLIIVEEAPGVHEAIFEAIDGIRAGGNVRVVLLGNPTVPGGPFYDAFTSQRALWNTITIDAFDTPNLKGLSLEDLKTMPKDAGGPLDQNELPFLIGRRYVREMAEKWGENNPRYIARVRGQFPAQSEWSLIPLSWIEKARPHRGEVDDETGLRVPERSGNRLRAGVDVGAGGEGLSVGYVFDMGEVIETTKDGAPFKNPVESAAADARADIAGGLLPVKRELGVVRYDEIGVGAYLGPHLKDIGFTTQGVNVAKGSSDPEKFPRLRDELYWMLREGFERGDFSGLRCETTMAQLSTLQYHHTKDGRIQMESKEDHVKRTHKSPDHAEAFMLGGTSGVGGIERIPEIGAVLKSRWNMHPR